MATVTKNVWDCRICTSAGLLVDSHSSCPNCGYERDCDETRAAWPGEALTLASHRFSGTDAYCCGMGWSSAARCCGSCGGSLAAVTEGGAVPRMLRPAGSGSASHVHLLDQAALLTRLERMGFGETSPALAAGLAKLFRSQTLPPRGELIEFNFAAK